MSNFSFHTLQSLYAEPNLRSSHLALLSQLTTVDDIPSDTYYEFIDFVEKHSDTYYILLIKDTSTRRIVGTGTLLIEQKLIHKLGRVGHIEDIVIDQNCQGFGLGWKLIEHLKEKARQMGCYKVILDCKEDVKKFYEKCGFVAHEIGMRHNININTS